MLDGNGLHEAGVKEEVSHNASEGIEPRNIPCSTKAKGFISLKPEKRYAEKKSKVSVLKRAGV